MMLRVARTPIIVVVTTGWLVPLFFSISSLLAWCQAEASPVVYGTERTLNSFPFLHFSQQTLTIAGFWCLLSLTVWTVILIRRRSG